MPLLSSGFGGELALRNENVTVGERVDRPRMVEPGGESGDGEAVCGFRLAAIRPSNRRRDIDRRNASMISARATLATLAVP